MGHEASLPGLANEFGQRLPRSLGVPLEAGREGACCLEEKLLPSLSVDLPQKLVDAPTAQRPIVAAAHAASCSSTGSTSSTRARAGRRKTPAITIAATSNTPRTSREVWKPLTAAGALATATPWVCA